jgi:sugar phosphate permease
MNIRGWQAVIFATTYFAMVARHSTLSGWSMSKEDVHEDLGFSTTVIGTFDTVILLFYAIGNFVNGHLGDNYPARVIVPIGVCVSAACIIGVSLR